MHIGCNWSKALNSLLNRHAVNVDYIKCGMYGDFHEQFIPMRSLRPILLHGLGYFENTGMTGIDTIDFDAANKTIKKCDSPHYGLHLAIRKSDMFPGMNAQDIYERMCKQVQIFKTNLEVPLLLENAPDTPHDRIAFDLYPYIIPDEINRILTDNDVSFLLDITHAKLTSKYRGFDVHDYLGNLLLHRVSEIHINGSGYDQNGFPMDTHQEMEEEDYQLLEWVLERTNPRIVTLEFNEIDVEDYDDVVYALEKQLYRIIKISSKKRSNAAIS